MKGTLLGATCGVGSSYHFESPEITPSLGGVRVALSWVFYVVYSVVLFVSLSLNVRLVSFDAHKRM